MATKVQRNSKPTKPAAKKTRAVDSKKFAQVQLPEGFTAITAGEFGDPWDYEANPIIQGVIDGEVREIEVPGDKRGTTRIARAVTVATEDGRIDVWESASLKRWFDTIVDGNTVALVFQGYRDTGRPSPMKVFVGSIADDEVEAVKPARKAAAKAPAKKTRR